MNEVCDWIKNCIADIDTCLINKCMETGRDEETCYEFLSKSIPNFYRLHELEHCRGGKEKFKPGSCLEGLEGLAGFSTKLKECINNKEFEDIGTIKKVFGSQSIENIHNPTSNIIGIAIPIGIIAVMLLLKKFK